MGLEAVEVVMEVEDAFQITITDDEAERLNTVGDIVDTVLAKVRAASAVGTGAVNVPCVSASNFRALQEGLAVLMGKEKRAFRPRTALADVMSPGEWRADYDELQRRLDSREMQLPPLAYGTHINCLVRLVMALVAVSVALTQLPLYGILAALPLVMLAVVFAVGALTVWRDDSAYGSSYSTLGDLAHGMRGPQPAAESGYSRREIIETVLQIICEKMDISRAQVRLDMTLSEVFN